MTMTNDVYLIWFWQNLDNCDSSNSGGLGNSLNTDCIVLSLLNILSNLANLIVWASIGHSFGFLRVSMLEA